MRIFGLEMGLIANIKQLFTASSESQVERVVEPDEQRGIYVAWTGEDNFWAQFVPKDTPAGVDIDPEKAYQIGIVYACINRISSDIAQLPIELFDESERRFRLVTNNPVSRLLNTTPDNILTGFYFRQSLIAMMLLFGSGYAWVIRRDGRPVELRWLGSLDVRWRRIRGGRVFYDIIDRRDAENVKDITVSGDDIIHLRYLFGQSPVSINRDTIGILKAAQDFAAKFFQNGGVMTGLLSSDQPMTKEQIGTVVDSFKSQEGKQTRMLPFGIKYTRFGVEPDKAQSVEARKFNAQEVCRVFNMPPAMIGLEGGSNYRDYENTVQNYVSHTLAPLCASIEAEFNMKLLLPSEQITQKFRHDMNELLRGNMKARTEFYDKMLQNGVFSRNEVRFLERYNPIDGGDIHTVQVNQIALSELENYSKKVSAPDQTQTPADENTQDDDDPDDINDNNDDDENDDE